MNRSHRTITRLPLAALLPLMAAIQIFPGSAGAQEAPPPIAADRPGQSTSPSVPGPGSIQIEAGMQITRTRTGDETITATAYALPSALARIGLLPAMELRIGAEYRSVRSTRESTGTETTAGGIASVAVGTKIAITQEKGPLPEAAFLLALGLPYGADGFRPAAVAPSFLLAMRSSLGGPFNLYYNLGGSWDGSNGAGTGLYTVALSAALSGEASVFAELYGWLGSSIASTHAADAGIAYAVAANVQIDLYGGIGITPSAPDYFLNAGLSVRLPR